MGVYRLTSYCNKNKYAVSDEVELRDTSIAIDLDAFVYYCCDQVLSSRARDKHLPTWTLMIGDAREIDLWVESFVKSFKSSSIKLVAVQDPPYLLSNTVELKSTTCDQRLEEVVSRDDVFQEKMENMMHQQSRGQSYSREISLRDIGGVVGVFPLARFTIHKTLVRLGVTVKTAPGEAEQLIAKMIRAGDVEYVLSKDSDCYIMKSSRYIPLQELHLRQGALLPKLIVRVFSPELIADNLGIEVDRLPDLAILCGNDFSEDLFTKHGLASHVIPSMGNSIGKGYTRMTMNFAVSWIQRHKSNLLDMVRETAFPEVYAIIKSVYQFYGFLNDDNNITTVEEQSSLLKMNVMTEKQYPKKVVALCLTKVLTASKGLELKLLHKKLKEGRIYQVLPTVDELLADLRKLFGFILCGLNGETAKYVVETLKVTNGEKGKCVTRSRDACNSEHSLLDADSQERLASQLHQILNSDLPIDVEDANVDLEKMEVVFSKLMAWCCFPKTLHEESPKAVKLASSSIVCIQDRLTCLSITALTNAFMIFNKGVVEDCDVSRFGWKDIDAILLTSILSSSTENAVSNAHLKFLRNYSSAQKNIIVLSNWYSRFVDGTMTTRHLLGLHSTTPSASSMFSGTLFSLVATLLPISYAVNRDGDRDGCVLEVLLHIVDDHEAAKAIWKRYRDCQTLLFQMLTYSSVPSSGFAIASSLDNFPEELSMTFSTTSVADKLKDKKTENENWKKELDARRLSVSTSNYSQTRERGPGARCSKDNSSVSTQDARHLKGNLSMSIYYRTRERGPDARRSKENSSVSNYYRTRERGPDARSVNSYMSHQYRTRERGQDARSVEEKSTVGNYYRTRAREPDARSVNSYNTSHQYRTRARDQDARSVEEKSTVGNYYRTRASSWTKQTKP